MKSRQSTLTVLIVIIVLLLTLVPVAQGAGLGVAPSSIQIDSALRGSTYDEALFIMNPTDTESEYTLTLEGDVGGWITFLEATPEALLAEGAQEVDSIQVPPHSRAVVMARIAVPDDMATGEYSGKVIVTSTPKGAGQGEGAGASVGIRASVHLLVNVTGTQQLTGAVADISAVDTEVNFPLRVNVHFRNTGNVVAHPEIRVDLYQNGQVIAGGTFADTGVGVASAEKIPVELETRGLLDGEYTAKVHVNLDGQELAAKELPVTLEPVGALTRDGEIVSMEPDAPPEVGVVMKVTTVFRNTGQLEAPAVFIGELYRDDQLVRTFESREMLLFRDQEGELVSYAMIEEPGHHTVRGYVDYGGKTTEVQELKFDVAAPAQTDSESATANTALDEPIVSNPASSSQSGFLDLGTRQIALIVAVVAAGLGVLLLAMNRASEKRQSGSKI